MRGDFLFNAAPKGYEEATTKQCTSRLTPTTMTTPSRSWRFDLNPGPGEARTSLARPLGFNPGALIEVNSSDYNPHIVVYLPGILYSSSFRLLVVIHNPHPYPMFQEQAGQAKSSALCCCVLLPMSGRVRCGLACGPTKVAAAGELTWGL